MLLIQRPARLRGQVAGWGGQPAVCGPGRQQPELIGAQVVIPVPDRRGLVQDRGDPGVLALLAALRVLVRPGRPRQHRGHEHQAWRAAGGDDPADTARRGGDPAGVATGHGQQPQRGLGAVLLPAVLLVRGRGRRVGPPGGEQQGAIGQERRAVLALRRPGQPGRLGGLGRHGGKAGGRRPAGAAGRDPPDAGDVFLSCRPGPAAGPSQPARSHPARAAGRSPAESRRRSEDPRTASPGPPRWVRANRCDAEQLHRQQSGLPRRCVPGLPGLRARAHSEAAGMIPGLGTSLGREGPMWALQP